MGEKLGQRRLERVQVDGAWYHPRAPHGTLDGYTNWGCRCAPCRQAMRDYQQDYRARRTESAPADEGAADISPRLKARQAKLARLARRVQVNGTWYHPDAPQHGTPSTYSHWGCRCAPCRQAMRDYQQDYRERRRTSATTDTTDPQDARGLWTLEECAQRLGLKHSKSAWTIVRHHLMLDPVARDQDGRHLYRASDVLEAYTQRYGPPRPALADLWTLKECAQYLGVGVTTAQRLLEQFGVEPAVIRRGRGMGSWYDPARVKAVRAKLQDDTDPRRQPRQEAP